MLRRHFVGSAILATLAISLKSLFGSRAFAEEIFDTKFDANVIANNLRDPVFLGRVLTDVRFVQNLRTEVAPKGDEKTEKFQSGAVANVNGIYQAFGGAPEKLLATLDATIAKNALESFHKELITNLNNNSSNYNNFLKNVGIDPAGLVGKRVTKSLYYYGLLNGLAFGNLDAAKESYFWPFC